MIVYLYENNIFYFLLFLIISQHVISVFIFYFLLLLFLLSPHVLGEHYGHDTSSPFEM